MARKIVGKLFEKHPDSSEEEKSQFVSLKDWKDLVSRLDRTQTQVELCNEKMRLTYSKVMQWLSRVREKMDTVSKSQKEMDVMTKEMFEQWEKKMLDWVQPEQRKEDQRRVMDLMHRHSQFIQSYTKQLDAVKKSVSKNEYQVYQLLEQMRTVRVEMDLINRDQQKNNDSSPPLSPSSAHSDSLCF